MTQILPGPRIVRSAPALQLGHLKVRYIFVFSVLSIFKNAGQFGHLAYEMTSFCLLWLVTCDRCMTCEKQKYLLRQSAALYCKERSDRLNNEL